MLLLTEKIVAIQTACKSANQVFVAFSGGVDSHVLLHLCASSAILKNKLSAVYVHHGLQKQADHWAEHCEVIARQLPVSFRLLSVDAKQRPGESPEETARNARYQALQSLLRESDVLLLGQHREDQLETVLLQLFRGAGLAGLAAMPEKISFGKGSLLRPLLDISQQDIKTYAEKHGLNWIEDPSNLQNHFDRNYLRNKIIPLIKERWPAVDKTVFRSSRHSARAQQFIVQQTGCLFSTVYNSQDRTLSIAELIKLGDYEQTLVIRMWLYKAGQKTPSEQLVRQVMQAFMLSRQDGNPQLQWQGYTLRRYQDKLYCLPNFLAIDRKEAFIWAHQQTVLHLPNNGCLKIIPASSGINLEQWENSTHRGSAVQAGWRIDLFAGTQRSASVKKIISGSSYSSLAKRKCAIVVSG